MSISIFILGIISMTAQAVFLREVLATFRAGEFTVGAALLFWLLWTSIGSGIWGFRAARLVDPARRFHALIPWYGVFGYFGVTLIGAVPFITHLTPGELVPFDLQFTAAALAFLPFNILGGYLFTLGVKALEREDSPSAGRAFTLEAFGSALSGAIVSLILVTFLSNDFIALTCPLLGAAVTFFWGFRHRLTGFIYRLIFPLILLTAVISLNEHASDYYYRGQTLLREKETKYGRLRVTRKGEQITFYSDASTLFSAPDTETSEYAAHIPMLAAENPKNVLVLGGGPGGIIDEVLKYQSVEQVTCVELDPGLFELAERFLEESWMDDPRVKTVFADGRAFLENTDRRFDVIIMNMPPPLSGVTNRYYTREFFNLTASRLSEQGIFSFSLAGDENFIPDDLAFFLSSIRATLRSAFPSVAVLPGLVCRFLAGKSPGLVDSLGWERFMEKQLQLGIETSYVRDYFLRYTMSRARVDFLTGTLDSMLSPSVNSDTKPSGYFFRTIVQGNLDNSHIIRSSVSLAKPGVLVSIIAMGIVIAVLFAGTPGKGSLRRSIFTTIISVGMTEISLEILAIMAYQSIFGFLYGRIALLVGSYMAGLALGSLIGTRVVERGNAGTKLLAAIQTALAAVPLVWVLILWMHSTFPGEVPGLEACFYILTALAGIAGGLQFPVADALYRISRPGMRAGLGAVYGVDLAGSSVGALVTGSLMIPILGMLPVLIFLAALNAVTAGVIWLRK